MSHGGDIYRNKVKLDYSVNLNPLGIEDCVRQSIIEGIEGAVCYPDPLCLKLGEKLSRKLGCKLQDIVFGNGASELLMAVIHTCKPKNILIPVPSFSGYEYLLNASCAEAHYYNMASDEIVLDEGIFSELDGIDMLFITNPNNPNGRYIDHGFLTKLLRKCQELGTLVVLDECFMELSDDPENNSCIKDYENWKNLVILRAFTKSFAIPGLRLGYLLSSDEEFILSLRKHLPEWNISSLAQSAGIAALDKTDGLSKAREVIRTERAYLVENLNDLGFKTYESNTVYIMFKDALGRDLDLYNKLLEKEIMIRCCDDYRGIEKGYFRIAVRVHEDNVELIKALKEIV